MKTLIGIIFFFSVSSCIGQGINNLWLLGYQTGLDVYTTSKRGTIDFDSGNVNVSTSNRKMKFDQTQGNIADKYGNLLMSSNGIWIADATGDTMMNGNNLNPGSFTSSHLNYGLVLPYGNVFIPWPGDSTKYVLFHMTGNNSLNLMASELYYSVIDMTLNGGLGAVTLKNQIIFQDTLSWGIGACKHANGRDWWIIAVKDDSNKLFKILLTPGGIASVSSQTFAAKIADFSSGCQFSFSPDGNKFAFNTGHSPGGGLYNARVSYFNFDRCTGMFSNYQSIDINDTYLGFSSMFSPNSKYLYASTSQHVFQVNTDSNVLTVDTIGTYDGYFFPFFNTDFWLMYLAKNNNIYITSGSSVLDLHCIEAPDSGGIACNLQQHSLHIPCYNFRTVPNHPNYFLGPVVGSICDSLTIDINEIFFKSTVSISPNPATEMITINAQNAEGRKACLFIYNTTGEEIRRRETVIHSGYITQDVYIGNLCKGIYIVKLQTEKGIAIGKFVKQ